jgi:hypothetical protein
MAGVEARAFYDELWRFSTLIREWAQVNDTVHDGTRPSARAYHVMASLGMDLWVHGGQTQKDPNELYSDELWLFFGGSTYSGKGGSRMLKTRIATAGPALRQRVCLFAHCCMCLQLALQGL